MSDPNQNQQPDLGIQLNPVEPRAFVGQPKADTRSVRQKLQDVTQKIQADQAETERPKEGAWVKKNNEWKFIERDKFINGKAPASIVFDERPIQSIGGRFAQDVQNVAKQPFKYFAKMAEPGVTAAGKAFDKIPYTEWVENVAGAGITGASKVASFVYDEGIKPQIRNLAALTVTPLQMVENAAFFLPAVIYNDDNKIWTASDASIWDQVRGLVTNTSLAQMVMVGPGNAGEGFFPGGKVEEQRNLLEERLRPKVYGQTATVGRTIAGLGVQAGLYEVGDDWHSLISGGIDAMFQVYADPMNMVQAPKYLKPFAVSPTAIENPGIVSRLIKAGITVTKKNIENADELLKAADEASDATKVAQAAGSIVVNGKNVFSRSHWQNFKPTGYAQNMFTAIAAEDDAYAIWATWLKGRSPRLAQKLAEAKTAKQVEQVFDIAVNSVDPYEHLYSLPGWSGNVVSEAGYRLKQKISTKSRIAAMMPRTGSIPFDDLASGAKSLDDSLLLLNIPFEQRADLMREFIQITSIDEPALVRSRMFEFGTKVKEQIVATKIQPIIDNIKAPLLKTYDEMTPYERATMKARQEVVSELEQIARKTEQWTGDTERTFSKYIIDDMGDAVGLEYMEGGTSGPVYPSQQNRQAINILPNDTKELDRLIELTAKWADLSQQARVIPGMIYASKALNTAKYGKWGLYNGQTLWKKAALFAGRYIVRVAGEESVTTALTGQFHGPFSYVTEVMTGRLNRDIYGRVMPYVGEADDVYLQIENASVLEDRILRAKNRGNLDLAKKLQNDLDNIDVPLLETRLKEIEDIIDGEVANVRDVMVGPTPNKAAETVMGRDVPAFIRKKTQQTVSRVDAPELWLYGVAQEVIERSVNPAAKAVAEVILSGNQTQLANVADSLYQGNLRKYFDEYFLGQANLDPTFNWDSIDGARKYVETIRRDITQITGGHEHLLEAIIDGKLKIDNQTIALGRRTAEGNVVSQDFLRVLRDGDPSNASVVPFAKFDNAPPRMVVRPMPSEAEVAKGEGVFSWFMHHAYGTASDKLARVPLFNVRKWNLVMDMVPMMSAEEAAKLRQTFEDIGEFNSLTNRQGIPKYLFDALDENIPYAQGTATLGDIENLAGVQATEDVISQIFDASKRSLFGRQHRILFPFFDAFREVGVKLAKTAINPVAVHRLDKAADALHNARIGGPGDFNLLGPGDVNGDGQDEGFVYKDPITGQTVVNVPLLGSAAKTLTGIPFDFRLSVGSMSLATSVIPSVGPIASFVYGAIPNRNGEAWDRLNKLIIPFGSANNKTLQEYFTPLAIGRVIEGLTGTKLLGDPNLDPVFQTMRSNVFLSIVSSGDYPSTTEGITQAMRDSEDKALTLWWMRGATQFFAPAAPMTQFYYETNKELIPLGVLQEGIRRVENSIREQGGTTDDQMKALVNIFGNSIIPYLANITEATVPGSEASRPFYEFKNNNPDLFNDFPDVAGYFGPKTNTYDSDIAAIQRRAGLIKNKPIEEVAKQVEQLWGNYYYSQVEEELTKKFGNAPIGSLGLSMAQSQVRAAFPNWDPLLAGNEARNRRENQMNEVLKIVNDPKYADLEAMPTLKIYLGERDKLIAAINSKSNLMSVNGWKTNDGGIIEREALAIVGDQLAAQNPSFKPLWDSVLSREFKRLTAQEKALRQAGQLP